jgi:hypothetical protein
MKYWPTDSEKMELRAVRHWGLWRQRRQLLVHLLAVLGSLFLVAALFPERVSRDLVAFYAALWSVVSTLALAAAAQEWRWHRVLMRESDHRRSS